jgi:hypothetical protein
MKQYSKITLENGNRAPSSTIRGLKLAIQHGAKLGEKFNCLCPNGNVHIWEIKCDRVHSSVGYAPRKKAARVGKGSKNHYQAKFLKNIQV